MGSEVSNTVQNTAMAVPSNIAAAFGAVETNINLGEQTPHMSIKGKVWKIIKEGSEKVLMTKVDGEPTPTPTITAIILNQVPKRSRAYFPDEFVEGKNIQPACWSINGETPSSDVKEPVATSCSNCEMSTKGSKISNDGKSTTACSAHKRICVVPSNAPDFSAMLLKLPVTSLWENDGSEEAQGWFAFDAYLKYLKANGVTHTAMVETKMKFDSKEAYPKVLFKHNGFITDVTAAVVAPRVESEEVLGVLGLGESRSQSQPQKVASTTVAGSEEQAVEEDVETAEAAAAKAEAAKVAKVEKAAKAKAARVKKAAEAKAAKEAKAAEAEAAAIEVAPVVETASDDSELDDIMSDWS
jgi:hypothetical protein